MIDPLDRLGELLHVPLLHGVWDLAGVEQVIEYGSVKNQYKVLYTVPPATVFYLTSLYMWVERTTAGTLGAYVGLRDELGAPVKVWSMTPTAISIQTLGLSFPAPLWLKAGGKIDYESQRAEITLKVTITGYSLPAPG